MDSRLQILIAEPENFSPAAQGVLAEIGDLTCRHLAPGEFTQALSEYDVIIFRLGHKISANTIPEDPRCKILATPVTGLDHIDLEACSQKGIQVVSLKGEVDFLRRVRATAELALGLTISLLRQIPEAVNHVKGNGWNRDLFRGNEIFEKTVGIIGLGRLGSIVASYFQAMGARVIGYDPRPDFPHQLARQMPDLLSVFKESDIITVHVSYGPDTHHLISTKEFSAARTQPVFINTARGGIVDEAAMLEALQKKRIRGAALDVIQGEHGLRPDNPLLEYARLNQNLIIVPHIGGNTHESFEKTELFIVDKIKSLI